jgi:hypothetical protein
VLGVHRDKLLPPFARRSFERWARGQGRLDGAPGGEAVLFQTCYVQHNEPQLGIDTLEVLEANGVDVRCAAGLVCCGMPAWERGDLEALRRQAATNLRLLAPFVDRGAKVVAINPTCSMMMRREYPRLVAAADRPAAERLAAAVVDPSEFLWSMRNEPRFSTAFRSSPRGPIAYHAPCHLRAQGIGFKGRDLLRKLPGVDVAASVLECSGHDGTYAMTVEGSGRRPHRPARLRRHARGRGRALGNRLPARGHPVRAARGRAAAAPDDDPRAVLPRGAVAVTMRPVGRDEIVDYVTYEERRDALRRDVLAAKEARRVHLGAHLRC